MTKEQIARIAHEVNRAYCEFLGDNSQPTWDEAPEWQKRSAIAGVYFHLSGDYGPQASHDHWMEKKISEGWAWGPTKRPDIKTHPCLVRFEDLPEPQKAKDYLFRGVVHACRGF